MCRGDSGRGLEPFARLAQQVAQRPDGGHGDGAGAPGEDQHDVTPPAHIHQRVVLLLIWRNRSWRETHFTDDSEPKWIGDCVPKLSSALMYSPAPVSLFFGIGFFLRDAFITRRALTLDVDAHRLLLTHTVTAVTTGPKLSNKRL